MKQEEVWAWTRSERLAPGTGTISFGGAASLSAKLPLRLSSDAPIAISGISQGKGAFAGTILLEVGPTGALEVYEELPFEEYLKGVLPGEMPTSWPVEALAAQAVAARSVSLATSATKHQLDGFWACSEVHCKVYKGRGAHTPASDEAVTKSAGEVLIQDGSIVPAVFCANCGGWSENNEAVWSAPPNAALRGREDSPKGKGVAPRGPVSFGLSKWLTTSPPGYCSADTKNYRWRRTFSNKEATALVNKQYAVGRLRAIEPGERGVSGRLLSLTVVGDKDRVEIRKELPIRQAFGTLPSALFIVESSKGASGPEFTFIGAGNGHGVGLCQHGARGMAQAGASHPEILRHYFASVDLGRIR